MARVDEYQRIRSQHRSAQDLEIGFIASFPRTIEECGRRFADRCPEVLVNPVEVERQGTRGGERRHQDPAVIPSKSVRRRSGVAAGDSPDCSPLAAMEIQGRPVRPSKEKEFAAGPNRRCQFCRHQPTTEQSIFAGSGPGTVLAPDTDGEAKQEFFKGGIEPPARMFGEGIRSPAVGDLQQFEKRLQGGSAFYFITVERNPIDGPSLTVL